MRKIACHVALLFMFAAFASGQDKPRVFITDSQSWEIAGSGGGSNGSWGSQVHGGARPQTAEIVKTFGERCPQVMPNNIQAKADYIVVLDHEGGKGFLRRRNKVAVFARGTGDAIVSGSTRSLGNSVQDACAAIVKHWAENGAAMRAAAVAAEQAAQAKPAPSVAPEPAKTASPKVSVASSPDGADIEIDGNFVGNTPSSIELVAGDHTISIKKSGYKPWERRLKITGGDIKLNAELEKNGDSAKSQ